MGADGWQDVGPWQDDVNESLRSLQRRRFDEQFDLPRFVAARVVDARRALKDTAAGKLPPELKAQLLELYTAAVAELETVQSAPLPTNLAGQLAIVRRVCEPDGVGGVLDVTRVGIAEDCRSARLLTSDELHGLLGTSRPTVADVRAGGHRLPDPGRGGCICFPLFDSAGQRVAWQFIGCEID